jgi:ATP-dependent protease ClpP protease subunit
MTAQEALEYGIIDQVFTKEKRTVSPNTQNL